MSGSGASRTLVLSDGIPLNDPFGSWVYWNRVPQASVDRVEVVRGARWVDDGVISSAGVSAGIDMAFYVVEKLLGKEVADRTARYIDYPRGAAAAAS